MMDKEIQSITYLPNSLQIDESDRGFHEFFCTFDGYMVFREEEGAEEEN